MTMGFGVYVEDEHGKQRGHVSDPRNLLGSYLPPPDDESFVCLRFLDPYGDTTFGRFHFETLLAEFDRIREKTSTRDERELIDAIKALVERARSEPHQYVKFYGD